MSDEPLQTLSDRPAVDDSRHTAFACPLWLLLVIVVVIVALDVFSPYVSFAILFAIPLVLLAQSGRVRLMWGTTAVFVALTYLQYFLKYTLYPPNTGPQFVNFRLLNRTLLAVMMCLLGVALEYWARKGVEPPVAPESLPPEQSDRFREMSRTFDVMLAVVIFPVLVIVIAATDLFSPANFNFPVLYTLPLFLCAWTRNRTLLWIVLITVLGLTAIGYSFGPPATVRGNTNAPLNRILATFVMVAVTTMLHFWITSDLHRTRIEHHA
jgi:hypothetical protein